MSAQSFSERFSVHAAINAALFAATFAAGSLGALLLLDAHDELGVYSAVLAFALRIVHVQHLGRAAGLPATRVGTIADR
ncbi:MAG TPA: hypothetical protein VGM07_08740 [Stellaceae bacterium]|jgi:hypothetical protein